MKKQELSSKNIKQAQLRKLKDLFPEAFTENLKIDWDKLRLTLGEEIDIDKERYSMNWPGKADCFKIIQQPSQATLDPNNQKSVDFYNTENVFIEGDNLEVLKLLQKSYLGKIKMIYIDPPYNTGKEFIYPDNYAQSLQTYLEYTLQVDTDGKKFSTNTESDGRFHSKWLNMMYPRLFLARNLLKQDGVIFISIDDNEVHNLRKICDEIFGEENFVSQIVWERAYSPINLMKHFSPSHDYVICYARDIEKAVCRGIPRSAGTDARYSNPDNDPRGVWMSSDISVGPAIATNIYPITTPSGRIVEPPAGRSWRLSANAFAERLQDNRIWFGSDGDGAPRMKRFLSELRKTGVTPMTLWKHAEVGHSQDATKALAIMFEGKKYFDYPKPVDLIKRCISLYTDIDTEDIVLDFFAGSGTTAHAVMQLNAEDGGNRKYICVQIPEPNDEKNEAYKNGYKTIADISIERIKRAGKKIISQVRDKNLDIGVKVFELKKSHFRIWDNTLERDPKVLQEKLFDHIYHISPDATQEDILFELILKSGFLLTTPIEKIILEGKAVFSIAQGQLLICLEKELTYECIKAMAEKQPVRVICLDESFKGENADALKTNAVQIMKSKGVVNFRTI